MRFPTKKTKIVCTIGPASWEQPVLEQMIRNGMNVARINLAHGDFAGHRRTIANVRAAAAATGERVALFGDLPGPKMRIGRLDDEPIELTRGEPFVLQTEEIVGDRHRASIDFSGLPTVVKPGDSIFMNDGYIQLSVQRVEGHEVHSVVHVGGELRSHKGVNFPGIDLGISAFTEGDRELLAFAVEQELDGVGVSFVQGAGDILAVREASVELDYDPFIIAKIERAGALNNVEEILDASDAIMVARGDLGVEIPIAEVPNVQKALIDKATLAGKPVITATQMLESMTHYRRPTRSEATDVANAILDGTDCVMLSGETAVGSFPVETVGTMADIARAAEGELDRWGVSDLLKLRQVRGEIAQDDLLALAVYLMVETLEPELIIVHTHSGTTARRLSRFGLSQWIVARTRVESACQRLQFSRGVYPELLVDEETFASTEERRQYAQKLLEHYGVHQGQVLLLEGADTLRDADTRRLDVIDVGAR